MSVKSVAWYEEVMFCTIAPGEGTRDIYCVGGWFGLRPGLKALTQWLLVPKRTIKTDLPPLFVKVSANFCG
jgi:hypothetical protein